MGVRELSGVLYVVVSVLAILLCSLKMESKDAESKAVESKDTVGTEKNAAEQKNLPQKPYGIRISGINDDGIEVYWKNTEYADGYEVYRSYEKDGNYEFIADTADCIDPLEPSHGTYQDQGFDHDKETVYYTLRSYEYDEQGEKVYSNYTKPVKAQYRTGLHMSRSRLYMPSGMQRKLNAYTGWGNAAGVVWESDDPKIAAVDQDGTVTAVSAGTCNVTCYSSELQEEKNCRIVVDREPLPPLEEITSRYEMTSPGVWENMNADKTDDAVIMMTGDMMCTNTQQRKQGGATGDFNFNESFDYVKDIISSSDLSVGNLETLLSSSWPYMNDEVYINNTPNCNAPSRYLDALKFAGFDGVVMSNNHNCDGGVNGAIETTELVDSYLLARTGVFLSEEDPRTLLADVNGIKVGFLSYTPERPGFNGKDKTWDQDSIDLILNYYNKEKAMTDVHDLRAAGAEYIIVYIHWGVKNNFSITDSQKKDAQELADMGVDYIVGGHSHLLQKYEEITAADGKKVPCFYSLGDFHSSINQIPGNRDSVILRIRLKRNESGQVELAENAYIPCYTFSEYDQKYFTVMPLNPDLNGGIELEKYEKFHSRILREVGDGIPEYVG